MASALTQTRYRVDGMDCGACATKIDTAVRRLPGVEDVSVSVTAGTMTVSHDPESDLDAVEKKVRGLGYKVAALVAPAAEPTSVPDVCGCEPPHDANADLTDDGHPLAQHSPGLERADDARSSVSDHGPVRPVWWRTPKAGLTIATGLALIIAYGVGRLAPGIAAWAFDIAMLVGLIPIGRRAVMAALSGSPFSIEMLMSIAAVGAVFIGAGEEGATVVFLFQVGELLEGVAAGKARASIQSLTKLVPKVALVERADKIAEVPADSLAIGAVILVRPGDRIPADGIIVSGESTIDEAPVTGESTPVRKTIDATVFAGALNGDGALRVRVTAAAADNTIARIVKLVEEAQESKAPTERFIDRFSRYYTPGVVVLAALVAVVPPLIFGGLWDSWIYKGLAILLIGCPCALVISTPAAIAASLSAGARRGLLLKGGAVLEGLGKITLVAFDKTGTLTAGKPKVTDLIAVGYPEADVLRIAAALESGSSHPLASAILAAAAERKIDLPPVSDATAIGGQGVTGLVGGLSLFLGSAKAAADQVSLPPDLVSTVEALSDDGKTVSVLLVAGKVAGLIAMRDEPRPDAKAGLKALTDAGIRIVMLTGDNRRVAEAVGKDLGIEVRAELLPQDKQRIVGELQAEGLRVAKIGDGINDAPALAAAHVGIAMGGGADVALETADAAILHGRVSDVSAMIDLSKRTMGNIHQNITIALALKAVFLVTTIVGLTGLWPAILADTGATVLVTLNALRLLRPRST